MNPEIEEMETLPREFDFAGIQPEDEVDDDEDMYYEVDENDLANNEGDRDYYEAQTTSILAKADCFQDTHIFIILFLFFLN